MSFQVAESQFKGSWAANFNGISTGISQESTISKSEMTQTVKGKSSHDVTLCLSCMDISHISGLQVTRRASVESNNGTTIKTDTPNKNVTLVNGPGPAKSEISSSGSILEKFVKGKRGGDAITLKEQSLIKHEVLRLVVNLSSAVTSKSHQQSLRR
jgi:hypothetical protein